MGKRRVLKTVQEKSTKMIAIYDKKRAKFFAMDPRCKECGKALDHMSRTMVCRHCQNNIYVAKRLARDPTYGIRYRQKHKKRLQEYQKKYYLEHIEEIRQRRKIKYQEEKRGRHVNI